MGYLNKFGNCYPLPFSQLHNARVTAANWGEMWVQQRRTTEAYIKVRRRERGGSWSRRLPQGVAVTKFVCLSMFFLLSCGAELTARKNVSSGSYDGLIGQTIEGRMLLSDGGTFDLNENLNKDTLILIFAQDTCSKCSREANEIAERIKKIGRLPSNVEIVTYLTGLVPQYASEDIADWISDHAATWKVGYEKDGHDLFRKYFPENPVVPSIIIQKHGKIIFAHTGEFGQEKMEEKTGDWL